MVSIPFLPSFLSHLLLVRNIAPRTSSARVSSDTPSPSQVFEAHLATSLDKLAPQEDTNSSSDLISFDWMCKAFDVVISTQSSAKQALHRHRMRLGTSYLADKELSKMAAQYMEDSVKLLDVCCLLKEALTGVRSYVKASGFALERLQRLNLVRQGDIRRAKHALLSAKQVQERDLLGHETTASVPADVRSSKRLSTCSSILRRMGDKVAAPAPPSEAVLYLEERPSTASMVSSALYGGEICTMFFLRLLCTTLSSQSSRKSSSPLQASAQVAWVPSLLRLQAHFNSEVVQITQRRTDRCNSMLVAEIQELSACMSRIYDFLLQVSSSKQARNDMKQVVDSTRKITQRIQNSIAMLEQKIDGIFSCLVDTRMAMLD